MPHYDYRCLGCGREFEVFQRMTDPPLSECEQCGGKLEKLMSAGSGLIFKGSGFYITDYKKNGSSPAVGSSSESKTSESKSESSKTTGNESTAGKSETKSEAKSETKSSSVAAT